jgi:hypothetical protein
VALTCVMAQGAAVQLCSNVVISVGPVGPG